ncbi:hypothetical protein BXZ70DRAFT_931589 [Cristinia sonorae]|uniref:BZIP domain-containing protein n=1 Tax=Cristinia sonorae TaxID=1940300 RepID=A0A8K0XRD4_9AGAR|nr:hypothetical protein BXZ70DRAFT_931589 [Cristinia sonorae]
MTPLPSLSQANASASASESLSDTQSTSSHTMANTSDKPERSRNAKAQARHRAKRKAYIEQLEQTVTKLQSVLALSPEQVGSIPPPVVRIRELETENVTLRRENELLRHQLEERNALIRPDITRRPIHADDRRHDRDMKRRRTLDHPEDIYMNSHSPHVPSPPPPLMIPASTQQYSDTHSASMNTHRQSSSQMYGSYGTAMSYQLPPGTPPGSSATSSPSTHSFSPIDQYSSQPDSHQRSPPSSNHTVLPRFSQTMGQYDFVKIEEDSYPHHGISQPHSYSANLSSYHHSGQASNGHWQHSYTSERP